MVVYYLVRAKNGLEMVVNAKELKELSSDEYAIVGRLGRLGGE